MERVERIQNHPLFKENLKLLKKKEKKRKFCRHGIRHLTDVARIAYILVLEKGLDIPKDVVYGTALVHDIGRYRQYVDKTPHNEAGVPIAEGILKDCDYTDLERAVMLQAVLNHRTLTQDENPLNAIMYQADKLSRACYACKAMADCDWEEGRKNKHIIY